MPCSKSLKFDLSPDTRNTVGGGAFALLAFPPETWAENEVSPHGRTRLAHTLGVVITALRHEWAVAGFWNSAKLVFS